MFLPPSFFKVQEGLVMLAAEGCDCLYRAASEKRTYCPVTGSSGFWGQAEAVWTLEEERNSVFGKSTFGWNCPRILLFSMQNFPAVSLNQSVFLGKKVIYRAEVLD